MRRGGGGARVRLRPRPLPAGSLARAGSDWHLLLRPLLPAALQGLCGVPSGSRALALPAAGRPVLRGFSVATETSGALSPAAIRAPWGAPVPRKSRRARGLAGP